MRVSTGSVGGKIFRSVFFFIFLAFGCVFAGIMVAGLYRVALPYFWDSAECMVLDSSLSQSEGKSSEPFEVRIDFSCSAGGRMYRNQQTRTFSDAGKAQLLRDNYPLGARVTGYVSSDHPEEAVLLRSSFWGALALLFPLLFVGVGLGGLYFTWMHQPKQAQAISEKAPGKSGSAAARLGMGCFFGVFFLAGAAALYFLALGPILGILRARSWVETPCVILSSEVESSSDGDTFRPNILYEYGFRGREYKSNRYDFSTGSSSGYDSKKKVVDQYAPGSRSVCFVNPENPTEAVLNRSWSSSLWFGLAALPFLLVGAGGMFGVWLYKPRKEVSRTATALRTSSFERRLDADEERYPDVPDTRPVELKSSSSPLGKFIGITIIAIIWNGITGVFLWQVIKGWMQGSPDGCLTAFITPFAIVGLALIYGIFYQLLALFNPRPVLRLSSGFVSPGDSIDISWRWNGRISVLNRVRIVLKGTEEATYRRGTTTQTDKNTFLEIEIANTGEAYQMNEGRARIQIPKDTMHSFESSHNKIQWTLHVTGEIRRWPDADEEFTLRVDPIPLDRLGR